MNNFYNVTLGLENGKQLHLTNEGFKSLQFDPTDFTSEAAAIHAFNGVDAQSLVQDGFKGYHTIKVWLDVKTPEADGVITSVMMTKEITVDTTVSA